MEKNQYYETIDQEDLVGVILNNTYAVGNLICLGSKCKIYEIKEIRNP
jgi:hypothetical protein